MSKTNSFSIDNIIRSINKGADWFNAKTRDIIETASNSKVKNIDIKSGDKSFSNARKVMKKDGPAHLAYNRDVLQYGKNIRKLMEGNKIANKILKISGTKWGRGTIVAGGIALGAMMIKGLLRYPQDEALPKKYKRGFDVMDQTMTDFGSAVHMDKVSQKVITPYYSSVRKGTITSVNSIMKDNVALTSSKQAIGHTRF